MCFRQLVVGTAVYDSSHSRHTEKTVRTITCQMWSMQGREGCVCISGVRSMDTSLPSDSGSADETPRSVALCCGRTALCLSNTGLACHTQTTLPALHSHSNDTQPHFFSVHSILSRFQLKLSRLLLSGGWSTETGSSLSMQPCPSLLTHTGWLWVVCRAMSLCYTFRATVTQCLLSTVSNGGPTRGKCSLSLGSGLLEVVQVLS